MYSMLIPYAYGIFKFQDIKQLNKEEIITGVVK